MSSEGVEETRQMRIRDAALNQFAAYGFKGASIREIARKAGVSPGMVQYYFPTKQALREECDAYAFALLRDIQKRGVVDGGLRDRGVMADTHRAVARLAPYVSKSLIDDESTATRWFDELAETYRRNLTSGEMGPAVPDNEDAEDVATMYTAMELGLAVFAQQITRRLGGSLGDRSTLGRMGKAKLYLTTTSLLYPEVAERIREGLRTYEGEDRSVTVEGEH